MITVKFFILIIHFFLMKLVREYKFSLRFGPSAAVFKDL